MIGMVLGGWKGYAAAALAAGAVAWAWQSNSYGRRIAGMETAHSLAQAQAADTARAQAEKYRLLEQQAGDALNILATNLQEARDHAQTETAARADAIRAGDLRLSIAVRSCSSGSGSTSADAASAAGDRPQARAELDPETAVDLEAIAGDGDDAIRAHAACVDAYERVRAGINAAAP